MAGDDERVIKIHGLVDLKKALRQIDKDLMKELSAGMARVAGIVLAAAQPLVPSESGDAKASMKVRKSSDGARLAVGGTKAPYYPWLDFGGRVGKGRTGPKTGSVARPVIPGGRYIYPAMREKNSEIRREADKVLETLARRAGFDTEGKG